MNTFLNEVVKYIYSKYSSCFNELLIIMPNRRSCLFLEEEFAQHLSGETFFMPKMISLKDWIAQNSVLTVADEFILLFNLYPSFQKKVDENISFDDFYYLGKILLNDFNEIDNELVNANLIFTNINEYKQLETKFSLDEQLSKIFENHTYLLQKPKLNLYEKIWNSLYDVYSQYRNILISKKIAYDGLLNRYFYEQEINSIKLLPNVIFVGLNALSKAEQSIVEKIFEKTNATFLWEYDEWYVKNNINVAGSFLRTWIVKYPNPEDFKVKTDNIKNKTIQIFEYDNELAQVKYLSEILEKINIKEEKTSIVLANEHLLQHVLSSLPDNIENVNVTMGYPVNYTWTYSYIKLLLQLIQKKEVLKINLLLNFLYHPFIVNKEWAKKLISDIKNNFNYFFKLKDNHKSLFPDDIKRFIFHENQRHDKVVVLCNILKNLEEDLSVQYNNVNYISIEIQAIRKIHRALENFYELMQQFNASIMHDKTWLNLIMQIVNSQKIDLIGEPLTGLQIMGLFETRLLDFENIIILSLNEDYVSSKQHHQTFIVNSFRKYFGLPTTEKREAIIAFHFYRLLQRSKNVYLNYAMLVNDKPAEPSAYIRQLEYDQFIQIKKRKPTLKLDISKKELSIEIAKTDIEIQWKNFLTKITNKGISRNAISDYIVCPLRFCYRNVLKLDSNNFYFDPNNYKEIGNLFHERIKKIFENFKGQQLSDTDLKKILKQIEIKINSPQNISHAVLWLQVNQFIKNFIENEIENYTNNNNLRKYPLNIISLEDELTFKLDLKNYCIILTGVPDLIFKNNNAVYILDFKLNKGNYLQTINNVDNLFQQDFKFMYVFQLFFYGYLFLKKFTQINLPVYLENIFYRQLESKVSTFIQLNNKPLNVQETLNDFEVLLIQLLEEMLNENISFKQTNNIDNCKNCDFNVICKKI